MFLYFVVRDVLLKLFLILVRPGRSNQEVLLIVVTFNGLFVLISTCRYRNKIRTKRLVCMLKSRYITHDFQIKSLRRDLPSTSVPTRKVTVLVYGFCTTCFIYRLIRSLGLHTGGTYCSPKETLIGLTFVDSSCCQYLFLK